MKSKSLNILIYGLSMVLINYNIAINSYAIILLERTQSIEFFNHPTIIHATIVIGILFGVFLFGFLNVHILILQNSFKISSLCMIIGGILSLIPGYITHSGNSTKLLDFSIARFIVGLGCGGLYSSVSTMLRQNTSKDAANSSIAYLYGPIGSLGLILAPLVITLLEKTHIFSDALNWKISLSIGTVPSLIFFMSSIDGSIKDTPTIKKSNLISSDNEIMNEENNSSFSIFFLNLSTNISKHSIFSYYLSGTIMAGFCFDIIFYGNFLLIVRIVDHLFLKTAYNPGGFLSVGLMGVTCGVFFWLGGFLSLFALKRISALAIQLHGFVLIALTFVILAISKIYLLNEWWPVLMLTYSLMYLFAGFGPGPMTYLMPSLLFSGNLSSPVTGLIAAIGKVGAIIGIIVAHSFYSEISSLMFIFAAISILGAGSTFLLLNARFLSRKSSLGYEPLNQSDQTETETNLA